jgi:hypothetical protein
MTSFLQRLGAAVLAQTGNLRPRERGNSRRTPAGVGLSFGGIELRCRPRRVSDRCFLKSPGG